ncbi:MAG: TauD/TfdA family dioxygenase [Gammaproteobacteria bacterium]|nr:TauD/TfdA family dioxygenase [Gammaproteobacteria bacterium]
MQLELSPLEAPFGAEVRGWSAEREPDGDAVATIRAALARHVLLVFRGHRSPTDADLVRFARHFGDLIRGARYFGDREGPPEILPVNNLRDAEGYPLGTGGSEACDWHSRWLGSARAALDAAVEHAARNLSRAVRHHERDERDAAVGTVTCTPAPA